MNTLEIEIKTIEERKKKLEAIRNGIKVIKNRMEAGIIPQLYEFNENELVFTKFDFDKYCEKENIDRIETMTERLIKLGNEEYVFMPPAGGGNPGFVFSRYILSSKKHIESNKDKYWEKFISDKQKNDKTQIEYHIRTIEASTKALKEKGTMKYKYTVED